jgi:hypothetical protein
MPMYFIFNFKYVNFKTYLHLIAIMRSILQIFLCYQYPRLKDCIFWVYRGKGAWKNALQSGLKRGFFCISQKGY